MYTNVAINRWITMELESNTCTKRSWHSQIVCYHFVCLPSLFDIRSPPAHLILVFFRLRRLFDARNEFINWFPRVLTALSYEYVFTRYFCGRALNVRYFYYFKCSSVGLRFLDNFEFRKYIFSFSISFHFSIQVLQTQCLALPSNLSCLYYCRHTQTHSEREREFISPFGYFIKLSERTKERGGVGEIAPKLWLVCQKLS